MKTLHAYALVYAVGLFLTAGSLFGQDSGTSLWAEPAQTWGNKLAPKSAAYQAARQQGLKPKGRSARLAPETATAWAGLQRGQIVQIPLFDGERLEGKVNLVERDANGWVRIGGGLTGRKQGSFWLGVSGQRGGGRIVLPGEELAYTLVEQADGSVLLQEEHISETLCFSLPRPRFEPVDVAPEQFFGPQDAPPLLSSRPGATAVLYLDFDGETVTDSSWNSGSTIVAHPPPSTPHKSPKSGTA